MDNNTINSNNSAGGPMPPLSAQPAIPPTPGEQMSPSLAQPAIPPTPGEQRQPQNTTKLIIITASITAIIVSAIFGIAILLINLNSGDGGGGETSSGSGGSGTSGDSSNSEGSGTSGATDVTPQWYTVQKDTARRNDLSRVDTSIVQYQTNNTGSAPVGPSYWKGEEKIECEKENLACAFVRDYLNTGANYSEKIENVFIDPDDVPYSLYITENYAMSGDITPSFGNDNIMLSPVDGGYIISGAAPFEEHTIFIIPGGKCDDSKVVMSKERHYAIMYVMGDETTYCLDDQ